MRGSLSKKKIVIIFWSIILIVLVAIWIVRGSTASFSKNNLRVTFRHSPRYSVDIFDDSEILDVTIGPDGKPVYHHIDATFVYADIRDRFCIGWDLTDTPMEISARPTNESMDSYIKRYENSGKILRPIETRKIAGFDFLVLKQEDQSLRIAASSDPSNVGKVTYYKSKIEYVRIEDGSIFTIDVRPDYCYGGKTDMSAVDKIIDSMTITGDLNSRSILK